MLERRKSEFFFLFFHSFFFLLLNVKEWTNSVVGLLSPWIELDSSIELVRKNSEIVRALRFHLFFSSFFSFFFFLFVFLFLFLFIF